MLQARQLGNELLVGVHSDEAILENKGPTVMTLAERSVRTPLRPLAPLTSSPAALLWTPVAGLPSRSPTPRT